MSLSPYKLLALFLAAGALVAEASPLFDQMSAQFKRDFDIQLVAENENYPLGGPGGRIDAKNTGERNGDMVLYFLRKEISKYPAELIRASGVKRLVLCRDLKVDGKRVAGVASPGNTSIYVDSTAEIGDEAHRRRTLHHEFYHFLDHAQHPTDMTTNTVWKNANAPGVNYGTAAPAAKPGQHNWASHPAPGFISDYSLTAIPEDRAELFAALMTNNLTLRTLLQRDPYLATKTQMLKDELHQFCPAADEAFWAKAAAFF
jgi:hypothetical protein